MITLMTDLPDQVAGFVASGEVTSDDYESVLVPAIESKIRQYGRIRILYQIGPDFRSFTAGAMWDDMKLGLAHLKAWEKTAVVTDIAWIKEAMTLLKVLIPYEFKFFSNDELPKARAWIVS